MTNSARLLRQGKNLEYAILGWDVVSVAGLLVAAPRAYSAARETFGNMRSRKRSSKHCEGSLLRRRLA